LAERRPVLLDQLARRGDEILASSWHMDTVHHGELALTEERVFDPHTGQMLNPDMEFYKLAGIEDVGEMIVHMMTGPGYDERGVIGLGEPPVIAPGAAIANAATNATGVPINEMPMTPERVLAAINGGMA